ncbi:nuclease domain-containing protein [Neobacillus drentensis]|uniref:nuclease domain-containing protein n=1 Tax=Neobacillus drentensis TaxID=220684 RepID=UPI000826F327|nr:nuclease domain-containing protein [Neobacillus drentensis]
MKVKALMAKFILDEEQVQIQNGKFVYKDVIFLENPEQYPELVVGIENRHKTFVAQSHFRGKERGSYFYVLVFQLTDLEVDEDSRDFQIKYSPKKEELEKELYYDEKRQIFFDQPKLKKGRDKKWLYSNSLDKAVFGSVNAGVFYFNVYKKRSTAPVTPNFYKACILPSSLSFEKYQEMLNDILNIRRELVMEQNSSKQSIQLMWKHTLEDIEKAVELIKSPLQRINQLPKTKIEETLMKVPIRNIKKFNSKTVMNLLLNEGNVKSISSQPTESTDIYENQMIYFALSELKRYLEDSETYIFKESLNKKLEIDDQVEQLVEQYGVNNLTDLEELIADSSTNPFFKVNYCRNMFKKLRQRNSEDETIEVIFQVAKYSKNFTPKMSFIHNQLMTTINGSQFDIVNRVFPLDFMFHNQKLEYRIMEENRRVVHIKGRKVDLKLITADYRQHVFLLYKLFELNNQSVMNIHAVVKKNSIQDDDPLRGNQAKNRNGEYYPDTYEYPISIVELKSINGLEVPKAITQSELESWFNQYGVWEFKEEIRKQINSLNTKQIQTNNQVEEIKACNEKVRKLIDKLDGYLQLPVLGGVTKKKNRWKLTQIFTNDKNYSVVWKSLRELNKKYEFTSDFKETDFIVKKTDELYEYWILIQILKIFHDTGWKTTTGRSFKDVIDQFLDGRRMEKAKAGNLEGFRIKMEHNGKKQTNHLYKDGFVDIEKLEVIIHFNEYIAGKKPDYAFELTVFAGEGYHQRRITKWFYLDAKYRNYQEQSSHYGWFHDINTVAIDHYLNYFHAHDHPSHASFLIHPDVDNRYQFFGGYLNHTMAQNFHRVDQLFDRNPRQSFGSISCIPGQIRNLKAYVKMMIEYHFVEQKTPFICWECGSTDTDIQHRVIPGSQNIKFHISCHSCGEFWVRTHCDRNGHKLVKHLRDNYHKEEFEHYPWYVKCPVCDFPDS